MKDLFVLGIVLTLFTCSLAEESNQNDIQKRNGVEHSLPAFSNYPYMRQTTVNHEPRVETINNMAHVYQQQQTDWEVQKVHAQAHRFQGSPQYQQYQQPWIPQPDYIQHNHINQQQQNHHHLLRQQQPINNNHINPLQQLQHYQHQYSYTLSTGCNSVPETSAGSSPQGCLSGSCSDETATAATGSRQEGSTPNLRGEAYHVSPCPQARSSSHPAGAGDASDHPGGR
ncbi:uncharacterized protein LOC128093302 [Culex pipiens pallens]|uniref:uncharacterized protein LOC128093302 n=1 Tax=Culex pipiens pallens TaxID=42434 RepID=UPI0022AB3484|nr:uncharacterized protein LOC128093302 [Culex pipiens pallens]